MWGDGDVGGDSDDAGHWSPLHHSHGRFCGAETKNCNGNGLMCNVVAL